jgi:general L-amino acid transport system substrate-binding protein
MIPAAGMRRVRFPAVLAIVCASLGAAAPASGETRLERIQRRGTLICGVWPVIAGFSQVDERGRYHGLDVDICRALAAAIFGTPDKVTFVRAASVEEFVRTPDIDIVSRRLTWTLPREGLGLLFGPVMFYDGQSFLVRRGRGIDRPAQLAGRPICVIPGTLNESNLTVYFRDAKLPLEKVPIRAATEAEAALSSGRCVAFSADATELASVRAAMRVPAEFDILDTHISKEPLAQVVRADDVPFFNVLRWTVFAMIAAEELGITTANLDGMLKSENLEVRRLLGVAPGNGRALGLNEKWAYNVIKGVGNYAEAFERNLGQRTPIRLKRGLNALWTAGGLLFAPPLR